MIDFGDSYLDIEIFANSAFCLPYTCHIFSACIYHLIGDFLGNLVDCGRTIKGFGGTRTTGVKMGAIVWRWEDNDGITNRFLIPN
jgi:hypothetical protein